MGTTRPVSPGWRAESSTTSVRSASAGRTPSSSAASWALAAQKSNWASASRVSRRSSPFAATNAESSSRIRPSSSCTAAWASRQALPSSTTTSGSTKSVCPLPDASWTMPLTRARASARTGTTYRPLRSVMIGSCSAPPELRANQAVEAAAQPVVGHPDGTPQPTQAGRGGVEELPDGIEAAGQRAAQGRQRMEAATEVPQERPALLREGRGESRGRVQGLRDAEELRRIQASAAQRAPNPRLDVVGRADPDPRPVLEQGSGLVRLVQAVARR